VMQSGENSLVFPGPGTEPGTYKADTEASQLLDDILNIENADNQSLSKKEAVKKYSRSTLTDEQKKHLLSKLDDLLQKEKIFINEKLSIEDIALKLDTNTKYISQIINETYNKNFYNFINFYRIEEAKRLLISAENDKYSILGIAHSVGFVSKSTFNVAFKSYTGMTPTEFKLKSA
jgi:AraC-like DNA-binding protein